MHFPNNSLSPWGWTPAWQSKFDEGRPTWPSDAQPARVVGQEGPTPHLETVHGSRLGLVSGRLQFTAAPRDLPLVGDWVAAQTVDDRQAVIHAVVPRATVLGRAVGSMLQQGVKESLLAANLDLLAIVTALDHDFSPQRALRLATLARQGGIRPLWILSKGDLPDSGPKIDQAIRAAGDAPAVVLSSLTGEGFAALEAWLQLGTTVALVGSSGVGKTTLVNRLLGTDLSTQETRSSDSKGRHTTTSRHLYRLPGGGLLMDTPGIRSVGLWADEGALNEAFADVAELAASCRFSDCRHEAEPGCAVREALDDGTLDRDRWAAWQKQAREIRYTQRLGDAAAQRAEKERWKAIHLKARRFSKEGRSQG